jgi:serine/threonine protein kinase/tetratricopeptide (TPR) repeat protein
MQIGTKLGAYEVIAKLGEGGMGEVYRARDTRLDRDVALKVLPADMVVDATRLERFSREARALAALNHPNIVTIHSTEEAGGIRFLTMELIDGKTLDRLIPASGCPISQLLEVAIPLCDAVAAAHEKHLTHRDLKPANVMVSDDGRVKVLDFGLASFAAPEREPIDVTRVELTHQGTVLGTAPYMSPEQVEGKAIDHRSDIFSLGIILYEMATGRRPFHGDSSPALMSSILKDTPPSLGDLKPEMPGDLARLIARCLEKDPRDRVQTARDVFNELKLLRRDLSSGARPRSSTLAAARSRYPVVAVGPFETRAAGEDTQVVADGLAEDITAGLSRFSHVRVGARAGARYVVEGTVREAGANLRIAVRLVDASSGVHLWAETYNRSTQEDLFALQDDLTNRIVATVADPYGVLVRSMTEALTNRPYDELTAAELVLRYYVYLEQFKPDEHGRLRDALEGAVTREPDHADAWAALSRLYEHEHSHDVNPRPHAAERARQAAERAVEVNPMSQLAWEALTSVHFFARDLAALRAASDRAIALNPLNTGVLAWVGMALSWAGDWERGVELVRRVMTYNAYHAGWFHFITSSHFFFLRRFEEALTEAKRINMPQFQWMHFDTVTIAGHLGRRADAQAAVDALRRINPDLLNVDCARRAMEHWYWIDELTELRLDGLRKALALADAPAAPATGSTTPQS